MDPADEDRLAYLEETVRHLETRLTAHEWFIEQHLANALIGMPGAEQFLDAITHGPASGWRNTEEGAVPARPDDAALTAALVRHIADKVRSRVRAGRPGRR